MSVMWLSTVLVGQLLASLFILSGTYAIAGLMTDYTSNPCRGQQVNLTCTVDGPVLVWNLPEFSNRLILSNATSILNTPSVIISSNNTSAVAILISNTNGLVSTISVTVQENITVQCSDPTDNTSLQSHRITLAGSPGLPQTVRHSIEDSTADNITVLVEWSPPTDNGGRVDLRYTVIILPPLSGLAMNTTSPNVSITVQYNMNYTLTITSVSCGGESSSLDYILTIEMFIPAPPTTPYTDDPMTTMTAVVNTSEMENQMLPIYTSADIATSVVITSVLSVCIGVIFGALLMYFIMVKKIGEHRAGQVNIQDTPLSDIPLPGPVYEEVALSTQEVKMDTNQAYGPIS